MGHLVTRKRAFSEFQELGEKLSWVSSRTGTRTKKKKENWIELNRIYEQVLRCLRWVNLNFPCYQIPCDFESMGQCVYFIR